jgi:cyanophycinase-like exopeptidase
LNGDLSPPLYITEKKENREEREKIHKKNQTLFMDEIIIDQHFKQRKKRYLLVLWGK